MDRNSMTEYIKVNFPLTEHEYESGNGEGMWMLVDPATKRAHDADAKGGQYVGILSNDSLYYPGLNSGTLVPFEIRGPNRPVADYHGFLSGLPRLTQAGKEMVIQRIAQAQRFESQSEEPTISQELPDTEPDMDDGGMTPGGLSL